MALLLLLLAALLAPSEAQAATRPTCRSGHTVSRFEGIRVFSVSGRNRDAWYGCGPRTRRPVVLYSAPGGLADFRVVKGMGRALFVAEVSGEEGGDQTTVGWFDGRRQHSSLLAGEVSNVVLDLIDTPSGSLGLVAGLEADDGVRISYLAFHRGKLGGELALSMAGGTYVPGSLAFTDGGGRLSWQLADGTVRSAPVAGEAVTCTSGTTLIDGDGERVFEVLPPRRTPRGGQADVLAVCAAGATAPHELAVSGLDDQQHWDIRSLVRAGTRLAFVAGNDGIAVLDGADARFTAIPGGILDLAIGASGPAVFVDGDGFVRRLDPQRRPALAVAGGDVVDGSLTVGDDGRVSWQTKEGVAQSAPLAGETAATCQAGTTLLSKDGLRVFEVLLAKARLFACPPGATAPVPVLTMRRETVWTVTELGSQNGRVALYAHTPSADDRMISLGADARSGVPTASLVYGTIREVALAPDGRVAVALHSGRRWTITVFALGKGTALQPERTLAHPRTGVRPGTLAFAGARIVWLDPSGGAHSVTPG